MNGVEDSPSPWLIRVKCQVVRNFILLLFSAAIVAQASGQRGTLDPAFEKIPFDQWLGGRDQARFHWTASVTGAELSFHQRLMAQVEIRLDGRDLESLAAMASWCSLSK